MAVLAAGFLTASLLVGVSFAAPSSPAYGAPPKGGAAPTAVIKNGTVVGVHSAVYNQDYFLGVPFAQPPVGKLRFQNPQSINKPWRSPLQATKYSAACVGYGSDDWPYPALSEDCLYLNIVRPAGYEKEKLPVAFWIHGGGLFMGSSIDERYNFSSVIQRSVDIGKPVIGVSINYRLSMWGFPTGEEVIKNGVANLGFKDQRLAMHWVQENIAAFGGDPKKVTIWGESAGALSTGMHLVAYNGRDDGLFRGAIMQSGNPINYGTFNYNATDFDRAAAQLGCGSAASKLDCLRGTEYSKLNTFINSTMSTFNWKPIIDGDFIQGRTSEQLATGKFVHVPIIDGANSDEGTGFGIKPMPSVAKWKSDLMNVAQPVTLSAAQADKIIAAYPPITNSTKDLLVPANLPPSWQPPPQNGAESRRSDAYYGDATFIAQRRKTCQTWAAAGVPAYSYRFNTIPAGLPPSVGATHFQEVAFVFNNKAGLGYGYPGVSINPFQGMPESYDRLAEQMSGAWMTFVHDLNPGSFWPKYAVKGGKNRVFDANVTGLGYDESDDWRKAGIDLINSMAEVYNR